ncbi:MAG: M56 family metallopeptidase, partial [Acidobacteria bacterium]|nr:M56 family metallopeptidase [Acidobacteriota bacterium]
MSLLAVLTIKVSAILLLPLIGTLLLRRSSASARHWMLAVGVVSAVAVPALHVLPTPPVARMAPVGPLLFDALQPSALPTAASPGPRAPARPLGPYVQFTEPVDADVAGSVVALQPAGPRPRPPRPAAAAVLSAEVVGRLVVTIWLVGVFAGLGVLLVGLARLRWFRVSSTRVTDGRWHRLCADLSRSCGLTCGVDLLLGPRPGLVATWGWWRPAVMLPASVSEWSAERMRVVLLHELAHARRGDWMLQMAAEALRCVWWFNPLAWMIRARLRRESEHAADDVVLAQGVPAATYATHLVELAREARKHRRTWLPAPAMARPSTLEWRLSAMLNTRTNRRPLTRVARFGSLGVLVLVSSVVAGLQVGSVSASRSAESTGNAIKQGQGAESSSGRIMEFVPVAAAPAAGQERVQVGPVSASRSAESIGSEVEQGQGAESSSG